MTQPPPSQSPAQPTRLGRYPVRRRLGAGAFATVWLAHDDELDSPVAIKVLADNWAGDQHVRDRFVEEGRFLRKVESPYVVPVYDAGELDDGRPYLVMAYADWGTLAERLSEGPLEAAHVLDLLDQVAAGLAALHSRAVLHRDVKPGNVLLRSHDGRTRAMLADLGLGKDLDMSSRLTMIAGTPSYVAPEQARGEPLDARADQFSLAALAHLLLVGRPPHAHISLGAAGDPPPLPAMGIASELEAVVRRGLSVDREQRYPDVESFAAALRDAAGRAGGVAGGVPGGDAQDTHVQSATQALLIAPRPSGRSLTRPIATAVVAIVVGVAAGWALGAFGVADVRLQDESAALSVRVPQEWGSSVQGGGWLPPKADRSYPALAAGTSAGWRLDGNGVFLGLLPGRELPNETPGHPECGEREPVGDDESGASTVLHAGCEGSAAVILEHVRQTTDGQVLWVQVRSDDRETATRVLGTVTASAG